MSAEEQSAGEHGTGPSVGAENGAGVEPSVGTGAGSDEAGAEGTVPEAEAEAVSESEPVSEPVSVETSTPDPERNPPRDPEYSLRLPGHQANFHMPEGDRHAHNLHEQDFDDAPTGYVSRAELGLAGENSATGVVTRKAAEGAEQHTGTKAVFFDPFADDDEDEDDFDISSLGDLGDLSQLSNNAGDAGAGSAVGSTSGQAVGSAASVADTTAQTGADTRANLTGTSVVNKAACFTDRTDQTNHLDYAQHTQHTDPGGDIPTARPDEAAGTAETAGAAAAGGAAASSAATAAAPGTAPAAAGPSEAREKVGRESMRRAMDTFRKRRGNRRQGLNVADGMVTLPFITPTDPAEAIIDPAAAIAKGVPAPTLKAGDIIAGQYEIKGPMAHGGLGWIYLAVDHNVSDRWVVLKGMMSTVGSQSSAVIDAERAFLADITHPGILKVFNFIDQEGSPTGYIVTEYVGGPSLRQFRKRQPDELLEVTQAIGYMLEILPALDYLHSRGVVYNDLKPDNILITEDQVKLIDLGAVTGIGAYGHIYGTPGFQAPEVAVDGPTIESDLYTVGRTLASLIVHLPVQNGRYTDGLPNPAEEPLFQRHFSLYLLLQRATHPDADQRFHSAKSMANQLIGVLREILATRDGKRYPYNQSQFSPQRSTFGTKHKVFRTDRLIDGVERDITINPTEIVAALPVPLVDSADPGARLLTVVSYADPEEVVETLQRAGDNPEYAESAEIPLGMSRALLELGEIESARKVLQDCLPKIQRTWRHSWYSGVTALLFDDYSEAQRRFAEALRIVPGEPAPKWALAATYELMLQQAGLADEAVLDPETVLSSIFPNSSGGRETLPYLPETTEMQREVLGRLPGKGSNVAANDYELMRYLTLHMYSLVWTTNPTTVSTAFGLARQLTAEGLIEQAISALDRVPATSMHQRMAQLTTILMLVEGDPKQLTESRIRRAGRRLEELPNNEPRLEQMRLAVMSAGLNWLREHNLNESASANDLLGWPFSQRGLREGLEKGLRQLARTSPFASHRFKLVDMANAIRPRTMF